MEKLSDQDFEEILSYRTILEQPAGRLQAKQGNMENSVQENIMDNREFIGFLDALNYTGFVENFDYISWAEKRNSLRSVKSMVDEVGQMDLDELRKLMTYHIRVERFSEGHLQQLYDSGFFDSFFDKLESLK